MEDGEEISSEYHRQFESPNPHMGSVKDHISMYDQNQSTAGPCPQWILDPLGKLYFPPKIVGSLRLFYICCAPPLGEMMAGFQPVCMVEVDLSQMAGGLTKMKKKKASGRWFKKSKSHWLLTYRIAFTFGSTELKAFAIWEDQVRNTSHGDTTSYTHC